METPATRLRQLRTQKQLSGPTEAAKRYGWNVSTYTQHENGTREISRKAGDKYATAYGSTMDFILRGKSHTPRKSSPDVIGDIASQPVPILSWQAVATATGVSQMLQLEATQYTYVPRRSGITGKARSVIVGDESAIDVMRAHKHSFFPGDEIIFDGHQGLKPGDLVVAYHPEIKAAAPRIYALRQDLASGAMIIELTPLNPSFPTIRMREGDGGYICGKVVKYMRSI